MKILITGHKGFIGQNLVNYINDNTDWIVDGYEWGDKIIDFVHNHYDWVIHLGAISDTTERNVDKLMEQNYEFSKWLVNECNYRKINFQYASSASVYGVNTDFNEESSKDPKNGYAWSKFLFDRWIEQQYFQIIVQGFRYFNVYGEHENHKGNMASPITKFTNQAKKNDEILLFKNSEKYKRDFVWVGDLCRAHVEFINNVNESDIWNIGTGKAISFKDVAEAIRKKTNVKIKEIEMPKNLKSQYQEFTRANLTKFNSVLPKFNWINVIDWINLNVKS